MRYLIVVLSLLAIGGLHAQDKLDVTFYAPSNPSAEVSSCNCNAGGLKVDKSLGLNVKFRIPSSAFHYDKIRIVMLDADGDRVRGRIQGTLWVSKTELNAHYRNGVNLKMIIPGKRGSDFMHRASPTDRSKGKLCVLGSNQNIKIRIDAYQITGYKEEYNQARGTVIRKPIYSGGTTIAISNKAVVVIPNKSRKRLMWVGLAGISIATWLPAILKKKTP